MLGGRVTVVSVSVFLVSSVGGGLLDALRFHIVKPLKGVRNNQGHWGRRNIHGFHFNS